MSVHNSKQPQMDLEVEAKESADQWKASFDVTGKSISIFLSTLFDIFVFLF